MRALVSWPWPGNVPELENFIERSVIFSQGRSLRAPLAELRAAAMETTGGTLQEVERDYILRVFRETGGVISAAASRLGDATDDPGRHDEEAGDFTQGSLTMSGQVTMTGLQQMRAAALAAWKPSLFETYEA
jgi:hypothetical protein